MLFSWKSEEVNSTPDKKWKLRNVRTVNCTSLFELFLNCQLVYSSGSFRLILITEWALGVGVHSYPLLSSSFYTPTQIKGSIKRGRFLQHQVSDPGKLCLSEMTQGFPKSSCKLVCFNDSHSSWVNYCWEAPWSWMENNTGLDTYRYTHTHWHTQGM